jgi:hypothetical protein
MSHTWPKSQSPYTALWRSHLTSQNLVKNGLVQDVFVSDKAGHLDVVILEDCNLDALTDNSGRNVNRIRAIPTDEIMYLCIIEAL